MNELSRLPKSDLDRLSRLEELPRGKRKLGELTAKMAHPEVLDRPVLRSNVAAAITKARAVGLYDTAETRLVR